MLLQTNYRNMLNPQNHFTKTFHEVAIMTGVSYNTFTTVMKAHTMLLHFANTQGKVWCLYTFCQRERYHTLSCFEKLLAFLSAKAFLNAQNTSETLIVGRWPDLLLLSHALL